MKEGSHADELASRLHWNFAPDIAIPSPDAHYVLEISKNLENETEELLALSGHTGAA